MPIPLSKQQAQFQAPKVAEGKATDLSKEIAQAYAPVIDIIKDLKTVGDSAVKFFKEREIADSKNSLDIINTQLQNELTEIKKQYASKVGQDKLDYYNGTGKYTKQPTVPDRIAQAYDRAYKASSSVKTDYLANYYKRDLEREEPELRANFFADKEVTQRTIQAENNAVQIAERQSNLQSYIATQTKAIQDKYTAELAKIKDDPTNAQHVLATGNYHNNLLKMRENAKIYMAKIASEQAQNDVIQGKSPTVVAYNQSVINANTLTQIGSEMLKTLPVDKLEETNGLVDDFVDGFSDILNYNQLSDIKHDILLEGLNNSLVLSPEQFLNNDGTVNIKKINKIAEGKLTQTERTKLISDFQSFLRQYGGKGLTEEEKEMQEELTLQVRGQVHDILSNKFKTGLDFKQINDFVSYLVAPISEDGISKNKKDMANNVANMFRNESLGNLMTASIEINTLLDKGFNSNGKTIKVDSDFRKQIKTRMQDAIQAKINQVANSKLDNRSFVQKFYQDEDLTVLNFTLAQMIYANRQKDKDGNYNVDSYKILKAGKLLLTGGGPLGQLPLIGDGSQDGDYLMRNVRNDELWNNKQFWNNLALDASMAMEYVNLGTNEDFNTEMQKQTKLAERAKEGILYKRMSDEANYMNTFSNANSYMYTKQFKKDLAAMPTYLTGISNTPAPTYGYNNIPYNLNLNPKLYDLEEIPDEYDTARTKTKTNR